MTSLYFGPRHRRLYGVWQSGEGASSTDLAVLLCYPFGQEYIRCHRMLRTLAERLARAGVASLRFDYTGTGDSQGTDEESRLLGWVDDVSMAHDELSRRAGGTRVVWLGVRLGATAALLASHRVRVHPTGLVLWEAIGSGRRYLSDLSRRHREALATSYSLVPDGLPDGAHGEVMGFGVSEGMRADLEALDLKLGPAGAIHLPCAWLMPSSASDYLVALPEGCEGRLTVLDHPFEWNAEESLNSALVPAEAVKRLLEACASFK